MIRVEKHPRGVLIGFSNEERIIPDEKARALCVGLESVLDTQSEIKAQHSAYWEALNKLANVLLASHPYLLGRSVVEAVPVALEIIRKASQPIPMLLYCPECGERHIDEGEWATRVHHTHSCQPCGHTWRPAVVPTIGVRYLPGFKNPPKEPESPDYVPGGVYFCHLSGYAWLKHDTPMLHGDGVHDDTRALQALADGEPVHYARRPGSPIRDAEPSTVCMDDWTPGPFGKAGT